MSVTHIYKTINLSVAAYVDIDMALRLLIAQSKERLKLMPTTAANATARQVEVEHLSNMLLAQQELTK